MYLSPDLPSIQPDHRLRSGEIEFAELGLTRRDAGSIKLAMLAARNWGPHMVFVVGGRLNPSTEPTPADDDEAPWAVAALSRGLGVKRTVVLSTVQHRSTDFPAIVRIQFCLPCTLVGLF